MSSSLPYQNNGCVSQNYPSKMSLDGCQFKIENLIGEIPQGTAKILY